MMHISRRTARRFVLGRQGLWPGRRWQGLGGVADALRTCEALQMDPLNVAARSHDIALWGRVLNYRPEYLHTALYSDRGFFEYGGAIFVYPISELPAWRIHMERLHGEAVRRNISPELLDQVRTELRERGPLGNRDLTGNVRVNSYRGRKDTGPALYHLWLTGETVIHHRRGFERVYDLSERMLSPHLLATAPEEEAAQLFARKAIAFMGLVRERPWANALAYSLQCKIGRAESADWLSRLVGEHVAAQLAIAGSDDVWYCLAEDIPVLEALEAGETPEAWHLLGPTTEEEAVFLAPLDIVSARGRAQQLFDFDYVWEVYKPAVQRRWGYYTLPVLWGDRLVARLDPRLDRKTATLEIKGFWLEDSIATDDSDFAAALARGLIRFAAFAGAQRLSLVGIAEPTLRRLIEHQIELLGGALTEEEQR
jgi:hypothetical protein